MGRVPPCRAAAPTPVPLAPAAACRLQRRLGLAQRITPHRVRHILVTYVQHNQEAFSGVVDQMATLMGHGLRQWVEVYDLAVNQRSVAGAMAAMVGLQRLLRSDGGLPAQAAPQVAPPGTPGGVARAVGGGDAGAAAAAAAEGAGLAAAAAAVEASTAAAAKERRLQELFSSPTCVAAREKLRLLWDGRRPGVPDAVGAPCGDVRPAAPAVAAAVAAAVEEACSEERAEEWDDDNSEVDGGEFGVERGVEEDEDAAALGLDACLAEGAGGV